MASPSVAGTPATTAQATATTSLVVNLPASIVAGETLLMFIGTSAGSPAAPTGWTKFSSGGSSTDMFWRLADGAEGSTVTVTQTSSKAAAIVYRISGAVDPTVTAPVHGNAASGTSASVTFNAVTPAGGSDDYLFIAYGYLNANETVSSYPTNYSTAQTTISSGGTGGAGTKAGIGVAARQLTASTDTPGTMGFTGSALFNSYTIAVYPAAVVAATPDNTLPRYGQAVMRSATR